MNALGRAAKKSESLVVEIFQIFEYTPEYGGTREILLETARTIW